MIRSLTCGCLRPDHLDTSQKLAGWVDSRRDHGGIIFIDLRDRYGITQVVFNPEKLPAGVFEEISRLRSEDVIEVNGNVSRRPQGTENPRLSTGAVELHAEECRVLNRCAELPFEISGGLEPSESVRLKHRYLDLRRPAVQGNFLRRHQVVSVIRSFLDREGYLELETPLLGRSTPEGARDFLVPSRLEPGRFYALPQSPQIYKQLFMVSGFDRYYQVVKCLRDEDLRADRQPEFTQVDIEASFCEPADIMSMIEKMMRMVFEKLDEPVPGTPFPRFSYDRAIALYGTDKPDTRYGMEISDLGEKFAGTDFRVFQAALEQGRKIKGFALPEKDLSNSRLKEYEAKAKELGAGGLVWAKLNPSGVVSPVSRFLGESKIREIAAGLGMESGCLFLVAEEDSRASFILGALRADLITETGVEPVGKYSFLWVENFPLFDYDETEKRLDSVHHPFTAPREEDVGSLEEKPLAARSQAYDLVVNGVEIGGGSIRIHQRSVQERVFACLGIPEEKYRAEFGFLLEALDSGAPPHGGIALGLDRLVALLCGEDSIREVIPFPKTQRGTCLMTGAPGEVSASQLTELGLSFRAQNDNSRKKAAGE